ncbi:MAG TPA: STT3 domain-containing protein, partial [Polyangia bacterium]|nr:STT3 domain-containing protein [Polyangia bacterium]
MPVDEGEKRGRRAGKQRPGNAARAPAKTSGRPAAWTLPPRVRAPLIAAGVVALLVVAAFVRVAPVRSTVFAGLSGVRLFDTDSYYHLRHARYAAAHFPALQRWDPGTYPNGQPRRYAGLFDVAIGGAALVAGGGHPDGAKLTRVAAFTPVVLGLAACLALFFLSRAASGAAAGLLALALVTLYPGNFLQRSLLGAVDHHVAEILLAILTAWGLHRAFLPRGDASARRWSWWRPDLLSALPLVIFFFTWYGAPIYLVLVATTFLGLGTLALVRGDTATARTTAQVAFRYGAGLTVTATLASVVAPWLIMEAPILHKALLAAALFALGVPAYLTVMGRAVGATTTRRPGKASAAGVALAGLALIGVAVGIAVAVVPDAGRLIGTLFEVKTNLVKEQVGITLGGFAFLCGAPGFIALLALPLAVVRVWPGRGDVQQRAQNEARLALVLFATLVLALWVRTHDYGYVAQPLVMALATDVLMTAWCAARSTRLRIAGSVLAAAGLAMPALTGAVAPLAPAPDTLADFMILRTGWEQAMAWMKDHTPPLAVPLNAPVSSAENFRHAPGNYGVQAFWDFGHFIAELGERPPVASGGISNSVAAWYLLTDEAQAVRALSARLKPGEQIRYVIADAQTAGDFVLPAVQMTGG